MKALSDEKVLTKFSLNSYSVKSSSSSSSNKKNHLKISNIYERNYKSIESFDRSTGSITKRYDSHYEKTEDTPDFAKLYDECLCENEDLLKQGYVTRKEIGQMNERIIEEEF